MSNPTMKVVGELQGKTRRILKHSSVLALTLGLSASGVASPTVKRGPLAETGGNNSTTATKRHWFQIGKASWYGPGFHGRTTANGETFDMYALTCAHRTIPLGSWVRVTNLFNKKTVFLRVNDRGPMAASLIVDLSYAASQKLGMSGLAKVKIEVVSPTDTPLAQQLVAQLSMSNDPAVLSPVPASEPNLSLVSMVEDR
jgi:rare lipoprotein A